MLLHEVMYIFKQNLYVCTKYILKYIYIGRVKKLEPHYKVISDTACILRARVALSIFSFLQLVLKIRTGLTSAFWSIVPG